MAFICPPAERSPDSALRTRFTARTARGLWSPIRADLSFLRLLCFRGPGFTEPLSVQFVKQDEGPHLSLVQRLSGYGKVPVGVACGEVFPAFDRKTNIHGLFFCQ